MAPKTFDGWQENMVEFDVSRPWVILAGTPAAISAADELSHYLTLLRGEARLVQKAPLIIETQMLPQGNAAHLIILRHEDGIGNGFSWRLEQGILNIGGESGRGLFNGLFDFLAALGFRWIAPNQETLPPKNNTALYALQDSYNYRPSTGDYRRRLLIDKNILPGQMDAILQWAIQNRIDALVFPLKVPPPNGLQKKFTEMVEKYEIAIEAGGWDLSALVPRRYYSFHREMFRMASGKRDKSTNFCPTSPDTIRILSKEARRFFLSRPEVTVFHLWPDRHREKAWCSCPTCRAFSPEEQNRIAANAAADVLLSVNPSARLSCYEASSEKFNITLRRNLFKLDSLPGEASAFFLLSALG
jgi:hypothetical protein